MIVYLSAHYHNWWRHGRHIGRKNDRTVTVTVFIRFSWNLKYNICGYLLGMGLHFSNLRHHLLVKMAVEKTVKTGSDANSKPKCRFWLILTRWTRIYAYFVLLIKTDRLNNNSFKKYNTNFRFEGIKGSIRDLLVFNDKLYISFSDFDENWPLK